MESQGRDAGIALGPGGGARRVRRRFLIGPLLIALAIVAFKYFTAEEFTNPETGETVRVSLSPEQEQALGLQSYQQVLSESLTILGVLGAAPPEWASTHPSHGTRIQRLREMMPAAVEEYRLAGARR